MGKLKEFIKSAVSSFHIRKYSLLDVLVITIILGFEFFYIVIPLLIAYFYFVDFVINREEANKNG